MYLHHVPVPSAECACELEECAPTVHYLPGAHAVCRLDGQQACADAGDHHCSADSGTCGRQSQTLSVVQAYLGSWASAGVFRPLDPGCTDAFFVPCGDTHAHSRSSSDSEGPGKGCNIPALSADDSVNDSDDGRPPESGRDGVGSCKLNAMMPLEQLKDVRKKLSDMQQFAASNDISWEALQQPALAVRQCLFDVVHLLVRLLVPDPVRIPLLMLDSVRLHVS